MARRSWCTARPDFEVVPVADVSLPLVKENLIFSNLHFWRRVGLPRTRIVAMKKKISVVTPCFNEEGGIRECYERVKEVFANELPHYAREHLFIDNCSTDRTVAILKLIALTDPDVKIVVNARNFGMSRSPYYGMLQATGDAFVPMVADLQTPPELIVDFARKWEEGFKMVIAVREGMQEGFITRLWRALFYSIMSRLSKVQQIRNFIGFGLFDRRVIDVLRDLDEPDPYFRGLVSEIGFEKAFVPYAQPLRKHGKSKHNFFDLLELAMLGLTTYSKVPIRLMTLTGLAISAASVMPSAGRASRAEPPPDSRKITRSSSLRLLTRSSTRLATARPAASGTGCAASTTSIFSHGAP